METKYLIIETKYLIEVQVSDNEKVYLYNVSQFPGGLCAFTSTKREGKRFDTEREALTVINKYGIEDVDVIKLNFD